MERYRFIDGDAHVFEPEDIWDNYLEKKYQSQVKSYVNYKKASEVSGTGIIGGDASNDPDPLTFGVRIEVNGQVMPFNEGSDPPREPLSDLGDAYEKWAQQGFPPTVYKEVMDKSGIDYMIVYPTVGLWITHATDLEPELATAIRRAYNTWLGDFCADAGGRVFGATSIDLRDPEAATLEVRRCVKEYGFKGVHFNPTPVGQHRLYDEACDPLWAELSDLGVPVGVHPGSGNLSDVMLYHYLPRLQNTYASVAFGLGNMIACTALIMGGVLERHPRLKVIFLESGAGWVAYWLERMQSSLNGGFRGLNIPGLSMSPIEYFQRQCFVSADQDDPGIKMAIEAIGDDNITTATDFSHPEGRRYGQAVEMLLGLPGVSLESKRKILWDNPLKAYPLEVG